MKDIKSMTLAQLTEEFAAMGEPKFRAGQVYRWLHQGARSFSLWTGRPAAVSAMRAALDMALDKK